MRDRMQARLFTQQAGVQSSTCSGSAARSSISKIPSQSAAGADEGKVANAVPRYQCSYSEICRQSLMTKLSANFFWRSTSAKCAGKYTWQSTRGKMRQSSVEHCVRSAVPSRKFHRDSSSNSAATDSQAQQAPSVRSWRGDLVKLTSHGSLPAVRMRSCKNIPAIKEPL